MGKPTDIEVFALRQHILSHQARLESECHATLKVNQIGEKPYMGSITVSYLGKLLIWIGITGGSNCLFLSPTSLTFDQCCQWMMFSREKLSFDYLEFENGWKPWEK